jgi:hypothetical protein
LERDQYTITHSGVAWTLQLNGHHLGSFKERDHALHAANVAARMSKKRGKAAAIQVRC